MLYDVAIIGSGPTGLFSAFELGTLKLSCIIIDALDSVGGQCSALYPEKYIYDIPAIPAITAQDLVQNLSAQIQRFNPEILLSHKVNSCQRHDEKFTISAHSTTSKTQTEILAKSIIIAAGGGSFGPNKPSIPGVTEYEDKGLHYFVKSKEEFRGKDIIIAGGGDSAADWSIALSEIAKSLTLVHRRNKFRALPDTLEKLHNLIDSGDISLEVPFQLSKIEGNNSRVTSVTLVDIKGENTKTLKADIILPFFGLSSDTQFLQNWKLNLSDGLITVNPTTMQTSIDGIYAIGDICNYPNKLKLILTGFSEAAFAAKNIRQYLRPNEVLHFQYSTTMFKS